MTKLLRVAVVVALAAVALGACGDDEDDGATQASSGDSAESSTTTTEAGADATVAVGETALGDVLVDSEGMTLYLFTRDANGTSACVDACASTWPPLEAGDGLTAGEGVDQAKLASIDRPDGTKQVTYAGKPLYRYAPDQKAGDTTGQGVGGVWYVVSPAGEAMKESAAPAGVGY